MGIPRFQLYLLDADGTLLDFEAAEEMALIATFSHLGLPVNQQAMGRYRQINEGLWQRLAEGSITREALFDQRFRLFGQEQGQQLDSQATNRYFLQQLGQQAQLIPGALATVQALSKRAKLAVLTNGATIAQKERFRRCGLLPYIAHLIISEEVGVEKPSPDIFAHALKVCGHQDKASVLMVGDEPRSDIKGAQNFGIKSCLFDPKKRHPGHQADYEISRLEELLGVSSDVNHSGEGLTSI